METTVEKALAELKSTQEWKPVYLLTGEENYLIDQLCDYLENHVVEESCRDFDQKVVYGRDTTMADVINMVRQLPMLAPRRLVVVKEAQDLPVNDPQWSHIIKQKNLEKKGAESKDTPSKNGAWERLAHYLSKPVAHTTLVLCYRYKAYKAIEKVGAIYEQKKLYDYQVVPWIAMYVKSKGHSITEKSAQLITDTFGSNRSHLTHELDKVMIALPKDAVINDEAIERYMGISKDYNVFELQDAIGQRNMVKCSRIISYFTKNPKEAPIQMCIWRDCQSFLVDPFVVVANIPFKRNWISINE